MDETRSSGARPGLIVGVEIVADPTVNYAVQQNAVTVVKRLRVQNEEPTDLERVTITITTEPSFAHPWEYQLERIPAGQTCDLGSVDLELLHDFLASRSEAVRGSLRVAVHQGGLELAEHNQDDGFWRCNLPVAYTAQARVICRLPHLWRRQACQTRCSRPSAGGDRQRCPSCAEGTGKSTGRGSGTTVGSVVRLPADWAAGGSVSQARNHVADSEWWGGGARRQYRGSTGVMSKGHLWMEKSLGGTSYGSDRQAH